MAFEPLDEDVLELWEGFGNRFIREQVLGCASALAENDFDVVPVPTMSGANSSIIGRIPPRKKVYFWDTLILEELGVVDTLGARGNRVKELEPGCSWLSGSRKASGIPKNALFLSTACAVTMDGHIVKIQPEGVPIFDPGGGPESILIVVGVNSIVDEVDDGFRRARDFCIPECAKRFRIDLPCTRTGHCVECKEPPAVCVAHTVVSRQPERPGITVVLIGEYLGR